MIRLLPLASPLHPAALTGELVERVSARLGQTCEVVDSGPAEVLLVVTGGVEQRAAALLEPDRVVVLLAHAEHNSLAAALEIAALARQVGGSGRILLLGQGGLDQLARLAPLLGAHRRLRGSRLGCIGKASDWLVASAPSPALVERTWHIEVVRIPMAELLDALATVPPGEVAPVVSQFERVVEPSHDDVAGALGVYVALRSMARSYRLDALTVRCFDLLPQRTTGCLALSRLNDEGIVAGCEGDLAATLAMMWARALTDQPGFMANPQDVDLRANTVDIAHCTIPMSMVSSAVLRSHFESSTGVGIEGEVEPGQVTLLRVGGPELDEVFVSDGELCEVERSTTRCRTQLRVHLKEQVGTLLDRPLGNHLVMVQGHWADAFSESHRLLFPRS
jgi:L-fucose isomerase-like protein